MIRSGPPPPRGLPLQAAAVVGGSRSVATGLACVSIGWRNQGISTASRGQMGYRHPPLRCLRAAGAPDKFGGRLSEHRAPASEKRCETSDQAMRFVQSLTPQIRPSAWAREFVLKTGISRRRPVESLGAFLSSSFPRLETPIFPGSTRPGPAGQRRPLCAHLITSHEQHHRLHSQTR